MARKKKKYRPVYRTGRTINNGKEKKKSPEKEEKKF